MQLIEKFHLMESETSLFEIGKEINLPLWDIIRYNVYVKYYYPFEERQKLSIIPSHTFSHFCHFVKDIFLFLGKLIFKRGNIIVLSSSRYMNSKGEYFDKSAYPVIETLGKNCLVLEPILGKKTAYKYMYDFSCVLRRFFISKKLPRDLFEKIDKITTRCLGENCLSYKEANTIYHDFKSDYFFYRILFSLKETKKLFITTGNPKATVQAAKDLKISTYLIQHAGIEFDEIDYSYAADITLTDNILFPDFLLTLGDYWCKNINVPAKEIISIGNSFFYSKPDIACDNSILIISTIIHGGPLRLLTKELANLRTDIKFVYKLHPNEFHFYNQYSEFFKDNSNVSVITNQIDTNILIAKSQLVILIVSAVIYEALNQNKKVAIYKKINYERQSSLANLPNVYMFDFPKEIFNFLDYPAVPLDVNFFKPTDYRLIKELLEIN